MTRIRPRAAAALAGLALLATCAPLLAPRATAAPDEAEDEIRQAFGARVQANGATDGQVLTFDSTSGIWLPADGATSTADLDDITVAGAAEGDTIRWNNSLGQLEPNGTLSISSDSNVTVSGTLVMGGATGLIEWTSGGLGGIELRGPPSEPLTVVSGSGQNLVYNAGTAGAQFFNNSSVQLSGSNVTVLGPSFAGPGSLLVQGSGGNFLSASATTKLVGLQDGTVIGWPAAAGFGNSTLVGTLGYDPAGDAFQFSGGIDLGVSADTYLVRTAANTLTVADTSDGSISASSAVQAKSIQALHTDGSARGIFDTSGGTPRFRTTSQGFIGFSDATNNLTTIDTRLVRNGVGIARIRDASDNDGTLELSTVQSTGPTVTLNDDLTVNGSLAFADGLGAIAHVQGPTDQALQLASDNNQNLTLRSDSGIFVLTNPASSDSMTITDGGAFGAITINPGTTEAKDLEIQAGSDALFGGLDGGTLTLSGGDGDTGQTGGHVIIAPGVAPSGTDGALTVQSDATITGTLSVDGSDIENLSGATTGHVLTVQSDGSVQPQAAAGGVTGPGSSTDNAFPRFDGTGGSTLQDGQTTEDDSGNVSVAGDLSVVGTAGLGVGSVSAPAYSFASDPDTGVYRSGVDDLAFSAGGSNGMTLDGGALHAIIPSGWELQLPSGGASDPSVTVGATNDGFFASGDGVGWAVNGIEYGTFTSSGLGLSTAPTITAAVGQLTLTATNGYVNVNDDLACTGTLTVSEYISTSRAVESQTGADTLTAAETWKALDNQGAGATDALMTLPAIADGLTFTITQVDSGTIGFEPPAGTFIVSPSQGSLSAGQGLWTNAVGTTITVTANGSAWLVTSEAGTTQAE